MRSRQPILAVIALGLVSMVSVRWSLRADDTPSTVTVPDSSPRSVRAEPARPKRSVQESLQRPLALPFAEPTSLKEVARHLGSALDAPVVLDLAALKRLTITPQETVQLELREVRLATGLKLLLDQVGLTFRVVPEDNLLILTDARGSDDPLDRVFSELKSLHRDIHELQDSLDDLRAVFGTDDADGLKMHKPTIIEEVPGEPATKPATPPARSPGRPRS